MITETTVANLALQRVGAAAIADGAIWTEASKSAKEIRRCYDAMRRAELRRNVWRFSIRTAILRAIDTTTELVQWADWSNSQAYVLNDLVTGSDGTYWICIKAHTGHNPTLRTFTYWDVYTGNDSANSYDSTLTYMPGELVYDPNTAAGAHTYMSLTSNNLGHAVTDATNWFKFTVDPTRTANAFIYPIGAGPASDTQTKNVFRLPYNFMREAPQAPKQGSYKMLGAPSALFYSDWLLENGYITSMFASPIAYRFAADVARPLAFDPLFIDGLSCRLAHTVCEPLTQSVNKLTAIGGEYNKFMSEARIVNGIETGATQPPEDQYITARY